MNAELLLYLIIYKERVHTRNYSAKDLYYKNAEARRHREATHSTETILSAQRFHAPSLYQTLKKRNSAPQRLCV